jgi:hypothetical protein
VSLHAVVDDDERTAWRVTCMGTYMAYVNCDKKRM